MVDVPFIAGNERYFLFQSIYAQGIIEQIKWRGYSPIRRQLIEAIAGPDEAYNDTLYHMHVFLDLVETYATDEVKA